MATLQSDYHKKRESTASALVFAEDSPGPCSLCGGATRVEKTYRHRGLTLEHGPFEACETIRVCQAGCRRPDGKIMRQGQPTLDAVLLPRSSVGYDVMTLVGMERFVHQRQREEIRATLKTCYGILVSTGQISRLAQQFVIYLETLHQRRAEALRQVLAADGGWPLHIDATGEDGRGTLLVAYAGWRRWVLGAWKIPTENAEAILPRLRRVVALFGPPCAIQRDLGRAMTDAACALASSLETPPPILACHLHFLRDVGKDLLTDSHDHLRGLMRRHNVRSNLRALARDLGRGLGTKIDKVREDLSRWLAADHPPDELPDGLLGLADVRALAQWILDYPHDGNDEGFPFDLPCLDLYRRCRRIYRVVDTYLWAARDDDKVYRALERLRRVVAPVNTQVPFQQTAVILEARAQLFSELRHALRLHAKPLRDQTRHQPEDEQTLQDVKAAVEALTASLRTRRPERGPAQNMRQAIDLVLDHLRRHGPFLWGHAIALPPSAGGGIRLVDRTNNIIEIFFKGLKHGERRRSGRLILTQDLEQMPAAAALAINLTHPDYVEVLCGRLEDLPRAFAQLDATDRSRSVPLHQHVSDDVEATLDLASSSLPTVDRQIIRSEAMDRRLQAAARRRVPRRAFL